VEEDLQGFRWRWILPGGSTITMANSAEDEEVIADLTELQVTDSRPMFNVYCCPHAGACRPRACLSCPCTSRSRPRSPARTCAGTHESNRSGRRSRRTGRPCQHCSSSTDGGRSRRFRSEEGRFWRSVCLQPANRAGAFLAHFW
jgi:hypothetical protein